MATIRGTDTQIQVQQPSLELPSAKTTLVNPILQGVEKLASIIKPEGPTAADVLNAQSIAYDRELSQMEAAGTLNNAAISALNRKHKLSLQSQLTKAKVDVSEINSATKGLENLFESDARYTVQQVGDITTQTDRDGVVTTSVNGIAAYKAKVRADLLAGMTPEEHNVFSKLPRPQGELYLLEKTNQWYNQNKLEQQVAEAEANSKLLGFNKEQEQYMFEPLQTKVLSTFERSLWQQRDNLFTQIMVGGADPASKALKGATYEEAVDSFERLTSISHLEETNPQMLSAWLRSGKTTAELTEHLKQFIPTREEFQAQTTTIDNLTQETLLYTAQHERNTARIRKDIPAPMLANAVIYKELKDYAFSLSLGVKMGGLDAQWIGFATSSSDTMRNNIAPNYNGFVDLTDPKHEEKQANVIQMINTSIINLKDPTTTFKSPLAFEDLVMTIDSIRTTDGYNQWSQEDKDNLQIQYNDLLNMLEQDPRAAATWRKEYNNYRDAWLSKNKFFTNDPEPSEKLPVTPEMLRR